ncbi:MAG: hypothetical protein ACU4EQ_03360 [Candidatus Nitrosoglobus sp.]|jgi:hypothetical protein
MIIKTNYEQRQGIPKNDFFLATIGSNIVDSSNLSQIFLFITEYAGNARNSETDIGAGYIWSRDFLVLMILIRSWPVVNPDDLTLTRYIDEGK